MRSPGLIAGVTEAAGFGTPGGISFNRVMMTPPSGDLARSRPIPNSPFIMLVDNFPLDEVGGTATDVDTIGGTGGALKLAEFRLDAAGGEGAVRGEGAVGGAVVVDEGRRALAPALDAAPAAVELVVVLLPTLALVADGV
jgi:hypothetical protein